MSGPKISYYLIFLLLLVCLVPMLAFGFSEASVHWAIARSVDIAIPFFLLAFSARPLNRYWSGQFTRWALRNRRYLGIGWGIAFLTHGVLILLLASLYPDPFVSQLNAETVNSGLIAFSVTAFMLATSNNWSVRFLSPAIWSSLHTIGGYVLLIALMGALLVANISKPWLWPFAILVVLLFFLRLFSAIDSSLRWARKRISIISPD